MNQTQQQMEMEMDMKQATQSDENNATRHVGIRIRIDELAYINTENQKYGVNLVLERTWKASEADISLWNELKSTKNLQDYLPDYHPKLNFINLVTVHYEEALKWEETRGKFMIKENDKDGCFYNRYKIEGHYEFTEEFEVQNYPFDMQDLSIIIGPENATIDKHRFVVPQHRADFMSMQTSWLSITEWDVVDIWGKEYVVDYCGTFHDERKSGQKQLESIVNFKIQVKRKWKG
eukprot:353585_1